MLPDSKKEIGVQVEKNNELKFGVTGQKETWSETKEVVDPGKTSFYADSPEELPQLMSATLKLDRKVVRQHARSRFSHLQMIDKYIELYHSLVDGSISKRRIS